MLQLMMKANMDSIYVYTITRINKNILEKQCQWAKSSEDAIAVVWYVHCAMCIVHIKKKTEVISFHCDQQNMNDL